MDIHLLAGTKLFHGIKEEEIEAMLTCLSAEERTYGKDAYIYRAGDDYYIAMKNKTEADCKTTLYPLNETVDVPKWTYHHMELSKKPEIEEILGHKYKGTYHEPVNSVEFVPLGVNKAKGIEVILDHTGISREDSYAFGDSANDIDMIKYVKYGVAMGNSVPELLEIAPYQTARVDEDGIEKGLKKFGLI